MRGKSPVAPLWCGLWDGWAPVSGAAKRAASERCWSQHGERDANDLLALSASAWGDVPALADVSPSSTSAAASTTAPPLSAGSTLHAAASPTTTEIPAAVDWSKARQKDELKQRRKNVRAITRTPFLGVTVVFRAMLEPWRVLVAVLLHDAAPREKVKELNKVSADNRFPMVPVLKALKAVPERQCLFEVENLMRFPRRWEAVPDTERTVELNMLAFKFLSCSGVMLAAIIADRQDFPNYLFTCLDTPPLLLDMLLDKKKWKACVFLPLICSVPVCFGRLL